MAKQKDFLEQKSQVEEHIVERGHLCLFLPKFHCELNLIEMIWGRSKQFVRNNTDGTSQLLIKGNGEDFPRGLIWMSYERMKTENQELLLKYARKCREFMYIYWRGVDSHCLRAVRKKYKSHRCVSRLLHPVMMPSDLGLADS